MNAERRKQLQTAKDIIEEVKSEEEEAKGNLPDSLQYGEQGDKMDEAINAMDEALSQLDTAME